MEGSSALTTHSQLGHALDPLHPTPCDTHSSGGPAPPAPRHLTPTVLHLCPDLSTTVTLYVTQVLNVPSGRLAPRNFSFSDIYALN